MSTFSTSERQKRLKIRSFLTLLAWKCASRHNGVHFIDISTPKSGLRPWVLDTFDLEMCFAPQRRALVRHLNFQKWSETVGFWDFWLGNVLRATTACTFSSLLWPAGSAPAALARFRSFFFHSESRLSYLFAHLHIFSSDFLHLLSFHFLTSPPWLFPPLLFHLCILSEVWLLNFLR